MNARLWPKMLIVASLGTAVTLAIFAALMRVERIYEKKTWMPEAILIFGILFTGFLTAYMRQCFYRFYQSRQFSRELYEAKRSLELEVEVRKKTEKELEAARKMLERKAFYDPLTDLANRALFMDRLLHDFTRTKRRNEPYRFAMLYIDLDDFKVVNDTMGHQAGDRLLELAARRVESCVRPGDTAARLGGDEFAVIIEGIVDEEEAKDVADRIAAELAKPFRVNGGESNVRASIGVALSSPDYESPDAMLNAADRAMYRAKSLGKNRIVSAPEVA